MTTTTTLSSSPPPPPTFAYYAPQLAPRAELSARSRPWAGGGFGASAAFVTLTPELACALIDGDGHAVTHQEIGARGLSVQQAWNAAARGVLEAQPASGTVEFWVRDASAVLRSEVPRGFQVRGQGSAPAAWLAHPRLFAVVHAHFTQVLKPRCGLTYVTRDLRELFVFDSVPSAFARRFGSAWVLEYSVGFPLVVSA